MMSTSSPLAVILAYVRGARTVNEQCDDSKIEKIEMKWPRRLAAEGDTTLWQRWFAWYPVDITASDYAQTSTYKGKGPRWVWMETIDRRYRWYSYDSSWFPEYRLLRGAKQIAAPGEG